MCIEISIIAAIVVVLVLSNAVIAGLNLFWQDVAVSNPVFMLTVFLI